MQLGGSPRLLLDHEQLGRYPTNDRINNDQARLWSRSGGGSPQRVNCFSISKYIWSLKLKPHTFARILFEHPYILRKQSFRHACIGGNGELQVAAVQA